jgi:hypothetical protein
VPTVGLIVNPAAGRDIRRLTGGASVVDNYAKRRVVECVLAGLDIVSEPVEVLVMPDKTGIGDHAVDNAPRGMTAGLLDIPITKSATDTRRAAAEFADTADVAVVLGGDGTSRDVALELGDVPLVAVSTGTNNVVPTAVDGTVAGAAAGFVAAGTAPAEAVTYRHRMVRAETDDGRSVTGLAVVGIVDRSFVGTRALLSADELLGGVVSRAGSADIGVCSIAGAVESLAPDEPGGIALRLVDPDTATRTARAIVAPGSIAEVGIDECRRVDDGEPTRYELENCVVSVDGERELEVVDSTVSIEPITAGPRVVDFDAVFDAAHEAGCFDDDRT